MTHITEEWKPIVRFPNYEISSRGRVRNKRTGCIQKQNISRKGYVTASFWRNGQPFAESVHVLVAEAFVGPRSRGAEVNHIGGIKTHNFPSNLEYTTHRDNIIHAIRAGLMTNGIFTDDQIRDIRSRTEGASAAAKRYRVSRQAIHRIKTRRTYDHVL
jgi:hypothetical protein